MIIAIDKRFDPLIYDFSFTYQNKQKSKIIMTKLDAIALIDLSYCLQRAEALIQVLGEAVTQNGNEHHRLMVEVIEEYLLRARKTLAIANSNEAESRL